MTTFMHLVWGLVLVITTAVKAAEPQTCARVAIVIGKATNDKGETLRTGQNLGAGSRIVTGPSTLLKIILKDDSVVDIGSSSRFVITACEGQGWVSKINLQLETGKIRANVNKAPKVTREEFKLKTPTSILAVRGTEFFVSWEQGSGGQVRENIGVSEGLVEVKSLFDSMSPGTMVGTGTEFQAMGKVSEVAGQIKVEAAGAPKVDQFTADEQRQFEQNTKADNQAFEKAVEIPTGKSSDSEAKNENKKTDNFLAAATKESGRGLSSESDSSEEGRGPRFKKAIGRVNAQAPGGAGVLSGLDAPGSGQINQPGFPNIVSATFVWGVKAP